MDDVLADGQGEVTADGARGGLLYRVGATGKLAPCGDSGLALDDASNQRCGGDEVDELAEERLVLVLGVVLLGGLLVGDAQIHGDELQALALNAGDDLAHVAVLHAVRLDENECTFSHTAHSTGKPCSRPRRGLLSETSHDFFGALVAGATEPHLNLAHGGAELAVVEQALKLLAVPALKILKLDWALLTPAF